MNDHNYVVPGKKHKSLLAGLMSYKKTIVATVCVLLAVGAFAVYKYYSRAKTTDDSSKTAIANLTEITNQANYRAGQGKSAESVESLEKFLQNDKLPKQVRLEAQKQLATAYLNAQMYQKAIDLYQQISQSQGGESATTAAGQAAGYRLLGNKNQAISFYQQAIELSKKELSKLPEGDATILTYEQQIKAYKITIQQLQESP